LLRREGLDLQMTWVSVLKPASVVSKPKNKGRWFRLPEDKKRAIQDDVLRREEIRKELAKYTDAAIARKHGIHRRTVNKLCKSSKT
jgi:hypothetical protein